MLDIALQPFHKFKILNKTTNWALIKYALYQMFEVINRYFYIYTNYKYYIQQQYSEIHRYA